MNFWYVQGVAALYADGSISYDVAMFLLNHQYDAGAVTAVLEQEICEHAPNDPITIKLDYLLSLVNAGESELKLKELVNICLN